MGLFGPKLQRAIASDEVKADELLKEGKVNHVFLQDAPAALALVSLRVVCLNDDVRKAVAKKYTAAGNVIGKTPAGYQIIDIPTGDD